MAKKLLLIALALLAAGWLFYSLTVSSVRYECEVVHEYKGRSVTARALAATREEAVRTAVTTACGQLANGMTELIQCENTPPKSQLCR
ncbi:MAG: hypothetical protein HYX74_02520 [Acidobacteria bacterium]|nr:hypothetical protein [Acidobacteriota bacterium]